MDEKMEDFKRELESILKNQMDILEKLSIWN